MILVAGRGTRLGAIGAGMPKALVPVGGRPLLQRHLEYLARQAVSRVVINVHHLARDILSFVDSYRGELEVRCIVEPRLLGTAGGVRNALPLLGPAPFFVLYGDVLIDEPLAPLIELHRRQAAIATLAVYESVSTNGKGVVRLDSTGRVTSFEEKGRRETGRAFVNSGLYLLEPQALASLPDGAVADFGHQVFPAALQQGLPIFGYRSAAPVIDIGTPDGLALARAAVGEVR